jgi:protein SCO1/2
MIRNLFCLVFSFAVLISCTEKTDVKTQRVLPIIGDYDIEYHTFDGREVADTIFPKVPEFSYLNQDSIVISSKDLKNKIWIADFMFTSCPTICPTMTSNMKHLSVLTKDLQDNIQFLSFSIDPKRDKPSVFRKYIKERDLNTINWSFFTGDEDETSALAHDFFHVGVQRSDDEEDNGFEHTDTFVLVDQDGHVRGLYEGTKLKEIERLEKDVRKLIEHEYKSAVTKKD